MARKIGQRLLLSKGAVNSARTRGYKALCVNSRQELTELLLGEAARRSPEVELPNEQAAARDLAQAQAGAGLAVLLILVLAVLASWLSGGRIK